MAKKQNKLTIDAFKKYQKNNMTQVRLDDDTTLDVRRTLSFDECVLFVNSVCNACFNDETGEYMPEYRHLLTKLNMLMRYANVPFPEDIGVAYEIISNTNICRKVEDAIDETQYFHILDAIDEKINYRNNLYAATASYGIKELMNGLAQIVEQNKQTLAYAESPEFQETVNMLVENGTLNRKRGGKASTKKGNMKLAGTATDNADDAK